MGSKDQTVKPVRRLRTLDEHWHDSRFDTPEKAEKTLKEWQEMADSWTQEQEEESIRSFEKTPKGQHK